MAYNVKEKIIFTTISMRGGGTERVISLLSDYWVNNGYDVDIMMIGDTAIEYELDDKVNVYSISEATGGSIKGRIVRVNKMRDVFRSYPDAVVIAMGTVSAMFTSIGLFGLKNRFILSERNDPNRLNHRPIKRYEKMIRDILYRKADRIVFQTHMAELCFNKSLRKKGKIILNPLSLSGDDVKEYKRERTIITAGRLTKQKNHKLLIDAFSKFVESHEDYSLLIFGKGELEEDIKEYISYIGMSDKIFLKGFSDNLYDELCKGGMYVSSSDWEGISNSLAEAMACGIPVIATDCPMGGSAMLIDNNKNGILIEPGNLNALICAMYEVADDNDFSSKISTAGRNISNILDVGLIAKEWEKLFTMA